MKYFWDFLTENKDAIAGLLAILGAVWGAWKILIERWWKKRIRVEVKAFDVITDPALLLPKLYSTENDKGPLADHNIKYQPRDPNRDIQAELKSSLNRSRYLLITAPTGYGKTREAGMLVQSMMVEGWRVLRVKTGWLDMPKELPSDLNSNRSRILVILDDLNGLFSTGDLTQSPRFEQTPLLSQLSYHDRLLSFLDTLEKMCTPNEIRVIATARSEIDQWKSLGYDENDELWKRFTRIDIPEPSIASAVNLLEETAETANVAIKEAEFEAIARKNDGTYRNLVLNLRRSSAQNKALTADEFTETLNGSWKDIYERAIAQHAAVKYIYDAIDVLRQAGVSLFPTLVEVTAGVIWSGGFFQRLLHKERVHKALHYLTHETNILRQTKEELSPSDGQIEVKGDAISWVNYLNPLTKILMNYPNSRQIRHSLFGIMLFLYFKGKTSAALRLIKKYISFNPDDAQAYVFLGSLLTDLKVSGKLFSGDVLTNLKRYEETEAAFRRAIELDPSLTVAHLGLAIFLQGSPRSKEAEATFHKAIELNPSFLEDNYRKVIELNPSFAEALFRRNIKLFPTDASAYYDLGELLHDLKRNEEAEAAFRKAIELNPAEASSYHILGVLLKTLERYEEAEAAYRKAIELNPKYSTAYYNLGFTLNKLKRYEEAEAAYRKAIELNPTEASAHYFLGLLLHEKLKRYEEAEAAYRKAIELNPAEASAYYNLTILLRQNIRDEDAIPILEKLVELQPNNGIHRTSLMAVLRNTGRKSEAKKQEDIARKLIENESEYNRACLESLCGNVEEALALLKTAFEKEQSSKEWARQDPDFENIHNDPRFKELVYG